MMLYWLSENAFDALDMPLILFLLFLLFLYPVNDAYCVKKNISDSLMYILFSIES